MLETKLRGLYEAGLTLDEIATINERSEGWLPSRSAVKRKMDALGLQPRHNSHRDLIPWRLEPRHSGSLVRHMLGAEGRKRSGKEDLTPTDRHLVSRLHDILFGRGTLMVVTYHPQVGFAFVLREDHDEDIVRPDPSTGGAEVPQDGPHLELVGEDAEEVTPPPPPPQTPRGQRTSRQAPR